jgi:hypothetical protein
MVKSRVEKPAGKITYLSIKERTLKIYLSWELLV